MNINKKSAGDKLFATEFNDVSITAYSFSSIGLLTDVAEVIIPNYENLYESINTRPGLEKVIRKISIVGGGMVQNSGEILIGEGVYGFSQGYGFIINSIYYAWVSELNSAGTFRFAELNIFDSSPAKTDWTISGTAPANSSGVTSWDGEHVYICQGTSVFKYTMDTGTRVLTYVETITLENSMNKGFVVSPNYIFYATGAYNQIKAIKANKTTGATIQTLVLGGENYGGLSYVNGSIITKGRINSSVDYYSLFTIFFDI